MATVNIYWGYSADGTTLKISSSSSSPATNLWVQDDTYAINRDFTNMKPPWKDSAYESTYSNVTKLTFAGPPKPYYTCGWFSDFTSLVSPGTININMKNVIDAESMFFNCMALTTLKLDTTNFVISKLVYADDMFAMCVNLSSITTTDGCWKTTGDSLISANYMFEHCAKLPALTFMKNIKTANLTEAEGIFAGVGYRQTTSPIKIDITGWDLTNLGSSAWNKSSLFQYADVVGDATSPPVQLTMKNVILGPHCDRLFFNAGGGDIAGIGEIVDIDTINTSALQSMNSMFHNCSNNINIDITSWDVSNVASAENVFAYTYNDNCNVNINISNLKFSGLTDSSYMFKFICNGVHVNAENIDISNSTRMDFMFNESDLDLIDLDGIITSNATTSMIGMFEKSKNYYNKFAEHFNYSNVNTITRYLLDATSMKDDFFTFHWCGDLSSLNDISYLMPNNSQVKFVDITSLANSPISNITQAFKGCTVLKTIYTGGKLIDWSSVGSSDVFSSDTQLVGGNGTVYDSSKVNSQYARCDLPEGTIGLISDQKGYFSAALIMNNCIV